MVIKKITPRVCFYITLFVFLSSVSIFKSLFYGNVVAKPRIEKELQEIVYLQTSDGCRISIKLLSDVAPNHVNRIKELCKSHFYDGLNFHRVIKGFMAQAGGKDGNMNYGSGKKIKAEFSNMKHVRGIVSMARASDPNSADSQFFIVTKDSPFLDNQYSIFGMVIDGMDCVDKIKSGSENENGIVNSPTKIISARIAIEAEIENAKNKKD